MNQNIRDIAKQAGIVDFSIYNEHVIENFANLIIRDCINAVYYESQLKSSTPEKLEFAAKVIKTVTEHFLI